MRQNILPYSEAWCRYVLRYCIGMSRQFAQDYYISYKECLMKKQTLAIVKAALESDDTVTEAERMVLLRKAPVKKKMLNARQAMEILNVSRNSLRAYVKAGKLDEIRLSPRKIRFIEEQVCRLAYEGCETIREL